MAVTSYKVPGLPLSLTIGKELPSLPKGRFTYSHVARWCAAQQNWDKIHYNQDYARTRSGLPDVVVNGGLKQHFLAQFLCEAFDGVGWIWRLDYRFDGVDLAGQSLEVRGRVAGLKEVGEYLFVEVDLNIWNLDLDAVTTSGTGIVVFDRSGKVICDVLEADLPDTWRVSTSCKASDVSVPKHIGELIGTELDRVESTYGIDLSRLRLFADAVMGLRPLHYDPTQAARSYYRQVKAPPLFPLHGLESAPGSRPLSEDADAMGREGVNEVGRVDPARLGLKPSGMLNGGDSVEIHSLAGLGERVCAASVLAAARRRVGRRGGEMLLLETLNRYWEAGGRSLLTERQTMVYRL